MKKFFFLILTISFYLSLTAQQNNKIVIRGYIDNPHIIDSITLVVWKHYYNDEKRYKLSHKLTKLRLNHPSGYFEFSDTSSVPIYISIGQKFNRHNNLGDGILNKYIAEPGDSITIFNFDSDNMVFYGKGKQKYECRYLLDKSTAFNNNKSSDTTAQLFIINQYKRELSPFIFEVMYTDIVGKHLSSIASSLLAINKQKDTLLFEQKLLQFRQLIQQIEACTEKAKLFSSRYTYAKIVSALVESSISAPPRNPYTIIKEKYTGLIREKLLTGYIALYFERLNNSDSLLNDGLKLIQDSDFRAELTHLQEKLTKGSIAYNFSLPDEDGNIRRLDEFKGKVVFIDFWFTSCEACVIYHKNILAPVSSAYKNNANIVFLTINVDLKKEQWLESVKSGQYTSPGNINLYTNGLAANHPVIKQYHVSGFPRPLLIDKEGKVLSTSLQELRSDINTLKKTLDAALK